MKMNTPEEIQVVLYTTLTTVGDVKDAIARLAPATDEGRTNQADMVRLTEEALVRLRQVELYVDEVV